jgi:hypothetical protein
MYSLDKNPGRKSNFLTVTHDLSSKVKILVKMSATIRPKERCNPASRSCPQCGQ